MKSEINSALILLSQQVLHTKEQSPFLLVANTLLDLDPVYFQNIHLRCRDLPTLRLIIAQYYTRIQQECISLSFTTAYEFQQLYYFIMDIALTNKRKKYIDCILSLPENASAQLMPFVQMVQERTNIKKLTISHCVELYAILREREEVVGEVMRELETAKARIVECMEQIQGLKSAFEAKCDEIAEYYLEKEYVMKEFGLKSQQPLSNIVAKYTYDLGQCQQELNRSFKVLKEEADVFKKKKIQFEVKSQNIIQEMDKNMHKNMKNILQENQRLKIQNSTIRNNYLKLEKTVEELNQNIFKKSQQINKLNMLNINFQKNEQKFKAILKLHGNFKRSMNQQMHRKESNSIGRILNDP